MGETIQLKIADIIIKIKSNVDFQQPYSADESFQFYNRVNNFIYDKDRQHDILINVNEVNKLPEARASKLLFTNYHIEDGSVSWQLLKKEKGYIYKTSYRSKKQLALINEEFNNVNVYVASEKSDSFRSIYFIIYTFLQVLLINYLALRKEGILVHAMGLKDINCDGVLFMGKSGDGKTTSAKIWHEHSDATVLNDDRIIIRRKGDNFFIYSSPWYGNFGDYLDSPAVRIESAQLKRIFFIHHSLSNTQERIPKKEAFKLLCTVIFCAFWDKEYSENIFMLGSELIKHIDCFKLGFIVDERIIEFTRSIEKQKEED